MVAYAQQGKQVVRLKGGDPGIFGRTVEEITALDKAAIPYEVIPGVTAALAASSMAGIPLTDRRWSSAVAIITGHECDENNGNLDLKALAEFPGTLVFYMGVNQRAAVVAKADRIWPQPPTRRWPSSAVAVCRGKKSSARSLTRCAKTLPPE